jgi:CTP:molybdopterin cytidylyltransferase MocA
VSGVAAVILAAGASSRLGSPKQLVVWDGETLLERAVRVTREAGLSPVVVVLGASAEEIRQRCALGDALVIVNERWAEGMGSSIRAGIEALGEVEGCMIMTCDMPMVTAGHLRMLMASGTMVASRYAGRLGVPAYFPEVTFPELLRLQGDAGARDLLGCAGAIELAGGEMDIDTVGDLEKAQDVFGRGSRPVA